ncbi:hypothetical protein BHM03_00038556 [Ensete ventricosum]|nr:hypothetical protein BHM03_00038556 [Ensete ventricosum]
MEKCWKMLISHRALARYFAMLDSTIIGPISSQAHSQSGSGSADAGGDTVLERELDRGEPGLLSLAVLRLAQRHRTPDKSIAGAEVILGGFATVVFGYDREVAGRGQTQSSFSGFGRTMRATTSSRWLTGPPRTRVSDAGMVAELSYQSRVWDDSDAASEFDRGYRTDAG